MDGNEQIDNGEAGKAQPSEKRRTPRYVRIDAPSPQPVPPHTRSREFLAAKRKAVAAAHSNQMQHAVAEPSGSQQTETDPGTTEQTAAEQDVSQQRAPQQRAPGIREDADESRRQPAGSTPVIQVEPTDEELANLSSTVEEVTAKGSSTGREPYRFHAAVARSEAPLNSPLPNKIIPIAVSPNVAGSDSPSTSHRGCVKPKATQEQDRALLASRRLKQTADLASCLRASLDELDRREDLVNRMMSAVEQERRSMRLWIDEKSREINEQRLQLAEEQSELAANRFELEQECRRFEKNRAEWLAWKKARESELELRLLQQSSELDAAYQALEKQREKANESLADARRDAEVAADERLRLQATRKTIEQHLELLNQAESSQHISPKTLQRWFAK